VARTDRALFIALHQQRSTGSGIGQEAFDLPEDVIIIMTSRIGPYNRALVYVPI